jgi:SAM-dependent methyltransferase
MWCVTVIDISDAALERARVRLGAAAQSIRWVHADVAAPGWSIAPVDVWHDRATFHFLTDPADRRVYLSHLRESVKPGGTVVIATFASDGPAECSGLPVRRYSTEDLQHEVGAGLELVAARQEDHRTPAGVIQPFQWAVFRRV